MANVINEQTLKATGGQTYADMSLADPACAMAMNASFLRASLATSIATFGVAAFVMGVGVLNVVIGLAIAGLVKRTKHKPVLTHRAS